MCTVTFIPINNESYLLTSNRDEKTTRPYASPPFREKKGNYEILYPRDPQGGGSWIACDNRHNAVCLLNGAFTPHKPQYPYRHSRGLIVRDIFNYEHFSDFFDIYDLNNIEPFTLVVIYNFDLYEFRWDGERRSLKNHSFHSPMIWSSVTLYEEKIIRKREEWFYSWIQNENSPDIKKALHFHLFGGEGNKSTDLVMERTKYLKTLSITSVLVEKKGTKMLYKDLIHGVEYLEEFEHKEGINLNS
jgi:uncharacterized protein with NRDE domain